MFFFCSYRVKRGERAGKRFPACLEKSGGAERKRYPLLGAD
jgi:hypothetical protein